MLIFGFGTNMFAVAPTVTDMVNLGQDLDYIARYIITHAAEFEPYMVEVAKVFIGSGVSGAITGAAALSTWAKFAAITAWGAVAGLATYDIVKGAQLIGALIELNDIKKGIVEVRNIQRYDVIGIQIMPSAGPYPEFHAVLVAGYYWGNSNSVIYYFSFTDKKYYNGANIVSIDETSYTTVVYATGGYKNVDTTIKSGAGQASAACKNFLIGTGMVEKFVEIANMYSFENQPSGGIWTLNSPGWEKVIDGGPMSGSNPPLFSENQPVGVITTVDGVSLLNALTPEEWGNVRSLQDIAPLLKFEYMPYSAYRNVPSYDDAPVEEAMVDTAQFVYPNSGIWSGVNPQTIQEIQQQIQSLTQTVQSILSEMQQVQSVPELQQEVSALQQTQVELADLVQTLSQTLQQVQTETQTNTEELQQLQEQYQTAVEMMTAVQTALENVNQVQSQVQTLTEQLDGVMTENDVIVRNLNDVQAALETIQEEFPQLREEVQSTSETLQQVQTQTQANSETLQQLETQIQTLSQTIQNISVSVDLSPVIQAVNEVSAKVDALTEQVQALDEYLHEGFFEKLAEKMEELLEKLFVPDPEEVDGLLDLKLPKYEKQFSADVSFSSESVSMPISLFGATVDLSRYISQYASGLKTFMNIFVSGIAAIFVIRAFRVHLNID